MIAKLRGLFRRYSDRKLALALPGFSVLDEINRTLGHVDLVEIKAGHLCVSGWALAETVRLNVGTRSVETTPQLVRQDVALALGRELDDSRVGFYLQQPFTREQAVLMIRTGAERYVLQLPNVTNDQLLKARFKLLVPFAMSLLRASPAMVRWYFWRSLTDRAIIKRSLELNDDATRVADPIPAALFAAPPPAVAGSDETQITIILPIYNAFDLLGEVLARVHTHTDLPWRMIMVEDCSTDERVRPFVRVWAAERLAETPGQIILLENDANLGFIGSVNRAMAEAVKMGNHVVLLNSDALVPAQWATRLLHPILTGDQVATVTPMSNDAEILSVPVICQRIALQPGQADSIDRTAGQFHPDASQAVLPTGVGFCMAMNIAFLRKVGDFDTAFGRGYGEEVDWCQRARAMGGRNLGTARLFVEHRGGMSFGSAEKLRLIQANNGKIAGRYKHFDQDVQDFIATDPLNAARLGLAIAWVGTRAKGAVPIYLGHSMGGGAEKYLRERVASDIAEGGDALVLRIGSGHRWRLEVHTEGGMTFGFTDSLDLVSALLAPLGQRRIVYSCGVGDPDPVTLPAALLALRQNPGDRVEVLFHDYFAISPSYSLLDHADWFGGVPSLDDPSPAHRSRRPDGRWVSLTQWREAWGILLETADQVTVFSQDSHRLVLAAYPKVAPAIVVQPHKVTNLPPRIIPRPGGKPVIAVLGNTGQHKGAAMLSELSRHAKGQPGFSLVIIGNFDPFYALAPGTKVHGTYALQDLPDLVAQYGITCWFIPSICPETFSYTTHEALATGMPVYGFDLGAQADALRAAENGIVIPFGRPDALTDIVLQEIHRM